jgi:hypothetical protein
VVAATADARLEFLRSRRVRLEKLVGQLVERLDSSDGARLAELS